MANSSLLEIRQKVRRITRSLSEAQLTTAQLDQYINTYVLYDFPETLRLFNLKKTFSFYTLPYIDTYSTTTNEQSPLYNFTNKYITTDQPVYIAGFPAWYSESRSEFFNAYPLVNSITGINSTGDGILTNFTGTVTGVSNSASGTALLQNNVLFSSIDTVNNGLAMKDSPILDATTGNPTNYGLLYDALTSNQQTFPGNAGQIPVLSLTSPYTTDPNYPNANVINYLTGAFSVTFPTPPAVGETISSQSVPMNAARPTSLLFYDGAFTVRPIPDQSYEIQMEVFVQPAELLAANQTPELSEWWQLIAWNCSKKIFEDRMDYESVNMIMPSLKEQERLVNRRTIVQQTSQRTQTIYSQQTDGSTGGYGWGNGWGW